MWWVTDGLTISVKWAEFSGFVWQSWKQIKCLRLRVSWGSKFSCWLFGSLSERAQGELTSWHPFTGFPLIRQTMSRPSPWLDFLGCLVAAFTNKGKWEPACWVTAQQTAAPDDRLSANSKAFDIVAERCSSQGPCDNGCVDRMPCRGVGGGGRGSVSAGVVPLSSWQVSGHW